MKIHLPVVRRSFQSIGSGNYPNVDLYIGDFTKSGMSNSTCSGPAGSGQELTNVSTGSAGPAWIGDYGARATKRWPAKHDNILWYTKDPARYTFNLNASDRIPYMAPGLVGAEKAARGKTPTDVWWHTIVSPTGKEKTGYATQKPLGILERIVRVHSNPGETVLDFFAGSGTTGEAAAKHGRRFLLIDESANAVNVMKKRLARYVEND